MPTSTGYYTIQDRMNLIVKVIATQQDAVNDENGDRHLKDADMALQVIEDITFARFDSDLALRKSEGWFGNA